MIFYYLNVQLFHLYNMEECKKYCETIPETTLCSKGMRKDNGNCITQR
jgi:hypothetical protein